MRRTVAVVIAALLFGAQLAGAAAGDAVPGTTLPQGPVSGSPEQSAAANVALGKPSERPGSAAERKRVLSELYSQLAMAKSAENANAVATAIERFWAISGSDTVDLLLSRTDMAMAAQDTELAMQLVNSSIALAPEHTEVWNQRAAMHFAGERYIEALADLNRVLTLDPNHFKALEGAALTLKEIGRKKQALESYRKMLRVNPFSEDAKRGVDELARVLEGQPI